MPYVLFIAGLLTMCVPEEASTLRFVLQGGAGLLMFGLSVLMMLDSER